MAGKLWIADQLNEQYAYAMSTLTTSNAALERIVIDCVSRASGVPAGRISSETDIVFGLGMAGDDGIDLVSDIRSATGVLLREYDF